MLLQVRPGYLSTCPAQPSGGFYLCLRVRREQASQISSWSHSRDVVPRTLAGPHPLSTSRRAQNSNCTPLQAIHQAQVDLCRDGHTGLCCLENTPVSRAQQPAVVVQGSNISTIYTCKKACQRQATCLGCSSATKHSQPEGVYRWTQAGYWHP